MWLPQAGPCDCQGGGDVRPPRESNNCGADISFSSFETAFLAQSTAHPHGPEFDKEGVGSSFKTRKESKKM